MDWEDIRHFLAVAGAGSLSGAARQLRVDHTTVARRIGELESALGVALIEKQPRGVALTEAGARVAALAEVMADSAAAIGRTADSQGAVAGTVRLSAPPLLCSHYLAGRIGPLHHAHPALVLELVADTRVVSLTRRDADIALRLARPQENDGALVQRKVADLGFALYAAPDYLATTPAADWQFIGFCEEFHHLPQQRWLADFLAGRRMPLQTYDLVTQFFAARAGFGVACLPCFLGDGAPDLRRAADDAPPTREIWLLTHQDLRRSPRVRAVLDYLGLLFSADTALLAHGGTQPLSGTGAGECHTGR